MFPLPLPLSTAVVTDVPADAGFLSDKATVLGTASKITFISQYYSERDAL
jgi:hypothetical protein